VIFMLLMSMLERVDPRRKWFRVFVLLVVFVGALENERRIVWVMILMALFMMYLITPPRGWKRRLSRVVIVAAPVLILYVVAGWNSQSGVFGPVQTIRSVVDTSQDRSAYWREVENWSIALSLRERPLLGLGLGGAYTEYMFNDSVEEGFKEFREWPHTSVLGQMLLMGLFAFTATWLLMPYIVFLAVRSYHLAWAPEQRVAALTCLSAIIACLVMAYGDTGAHFAQYKIFLALALTVAAHLAGETGAMRPVRPRPAT
jgi:predicted PurR-regulated permease PerM